MIPRYALAVLLAVCCFALPLPTRAEEPATVDFATQIKPLLAASCYRCHGPEKQEGGLRLDIKSRALQGGDTGAAILAGKPGQGELVSRISTEDEDLRMPPDGKPLAADQIDLIRRWIAAGAVWPDEADSVPIKTNHWAFQPIARPDVPRVSRQDWVRNPIDAFVLARLEAEDVQPSPLANRATLLRRLSLDLTGLPPTPEEVEAFLQDDSPQAYANLVEKLLASPHFGERWSLQWLDLARYADSDGYEKDLPRPHAWRWRDWLIEAINRDLPFDQFTVQQVAGDLLPGATLETQLATGFHRNTLTNREGGVDQEEFRVKAVVDRVNTVFTVWMGLTVGCAQCHSHKYDPITQREFYQLYAFFNSANEQDLPVPPSAKQQAAYEQALATHEAAIKKLEAELAALQPALSQRQREWEASQQSRLSVDWKPLKFFEAQAASGAKLNAQQDGSILAEPAAGEDTFTVTWETDLNALSGFRLETLPGQPFALHDVKLQVTPQDGQAGRLALTQAKASTSAEGKPATAVLLAGSDQSWSPAAFDQPASLDVAVGSQSSETGWLGNKLADGARDGATNLLNVYHGTPLPAPGTVDSFQFFTRGATGSQGHFYLLRPEGDSYRVVNKLLVTGDGTQGVREIKLEEPWLVSSGDLFAHSGNSGPTYAGNGNSPDQIYYPISQLPEQNTLVKLDKLSKFPKRDYALQVHFTPAETGTEFVEPKWEGPAKLTLTVSGNPLPQRFRVLATDQQNPLSPNPDNLPESIVAILKNQAEERSDEEAQSLADHYLTIDPHGKQLNQRLSEQKKKAPKQPESLAHVMRAGNPRKTHVHLRGNFMEPGDPVQRDTPEFLPPLAARGMQPDRLDLARWIVSEENPLAARVAVNHVWSMLFGRGLVKTTEDFGTQGEPPSHPELLDWLASEYPRLGWSRKELIRLIVQSNTYQQASAIRDDLRDRDPENRWLARQNRFRLSAELVRDQYLATAGLLNQRVGGPSFRPELPASVTAVQFVNQWKADPGEIQYSRGLYIHLQRNLLLPMLMTFDRPDSILTCTRRERSNTPLQALTLLNAPLFVESAQRLAERIVREVPGDRHGQIQQAFLLVLGRQPSAAEAARVDRLHQELTDIYAADAEAAKQLVGQAKFESLPVEDAAAWVAVARALLNLDEFITRE